MKINLTKYVAMASMVAFVVAPLVTPLSTVSAVQATVGIYDNYFSPQTITVSPGSTVSWTNYGSMNHTVTSDTGLFTSGSLTPGSTFTVTFPVAGTFRYYCQFHGSPGGGGMSATVIVQDGAPNSTTNSISGTVIQSGPGPIVVNSITPMQTSGTADNTFDHGWKWMFDVTVPANEPNLAMKFDNWLMNNSANVIPVASNMRFYSAQSSNAFNQGTAVYITGANTYSNWMFLTGDLDSSSSTRRVQITVEARIPNGSATGTYTTNSGIQTQ